MGSFEVEDLPQNPTWLEWPRRFAGLPMRAGSNRLIVAVDCD